MFTIRIDRTTDGERAGYEARHYRVEPGPPTRLVLAVLAPDGESFTDEVVLLSTGERAYVMNAQGDTVDTVRPRERVA